VSISAAEIDIRRKPTGWSTSPIPRAQSRAHGFGIVSERQTMESRALGLEMVRGSMGVFFRFPIGTLIAIVGPNGRDRSTEAPAVIVLSRRWQQCGLTRMARSMIPAVV
jgi:hypothetical protein